MKKFMLLHFGFEKPTPEIMAAWGQWFESVADKIVDQGGHFSGGREISRIRPESCRKRNGVTSEQEKRVAGNGDNKEVTP